MRNRIDVRRATWALSLVGLCVLAACGDAERPPGARLSLLETLAGGDTAGFERAIAPRPFEFPRDHGSHPTFRTEWWYVTGNLTSDDGRDYGFQLTIFRNALAPLAPDTESEWGTNQAYMAHFTVTDVAGRDFHAFERFARGAVGLAGAEAEPLRVWLGDWALEAVSAETFPLDLRAAADDIDLRLRLDRGKPAVLHGERGLSRKGADPGDASYYYSHTRLPASGTLVIGSDTVTVRGAAWLDREWSTSALGVGQVGWDWFAVQLADGWDLMLYRIRRADGTADPFSAGALIDPAGARIPVSWGEEVTMQQTASWASPRDGALYPAGWRVHVPARGWDLSVEPLVADQELDLAFRYWEGAVRVTGIGEGRAPVSGRGYAELTGYAGMRPTR